MKTKHADLRIQLSHGFRKVAEMRSASKKKGTRDYAAKAYRFVEVRHEDSESIIIPRVSSERREYIPIGYLTKDIIVKDSAYAVYNAKPHHFALLTSKMHMAYLRAVAGRLKSDYRYSSLLCYNTFPVPNINDPQKQLLTEHVMEVLQQRENYPEKTLAQLYDPDKMPAGLRAAHQALDLAVDRLYRKAEFTSDEERLEHLFKRYEAMIEQERNNK